MLTHRDADAVPGHAHVVQQRVHGHRVERERQRKLLRQRHREHACSDIITSRLQNWCSSHARPNALESLSQRAMMQGALLKEAPVEEEGHAQQHSGQQKCHRSL